MNQLQIHVGSNFTTASNSLASRSTHGSLDPHVELNQRVMRLKLLTGPWKVVLTGEEHIRLWLHKVSLKLFSERKG
jgi:hypothetical protein